MPEEAARANVVLVGGGGHALVVAESAFLSGWTVMGFLDDVLAPVAASRGGLARLGVLRDLPADGVCILAVGGVGVRRGLIDQAGDRRWAVVVSPQAFVSPSSSIGQGVFAGPGAVVHSCASVGAHAIINTAAVVEHECRIGENVHVAPGSVIGGNASIGQDTLVGLGAVVLPGVRIGERCVVGAGAVVARDIPDGKLVVGVPAREGPTRSRGS